MSDAIEALKPYVRWCEENGFEAIPAKDVSVVAYLMRLPGVTPADVRAFSEALAEVHLEQGLPDPLARPELADMVRKLMNLTLPGE